LALDADWGCYLQSRAAHTADLADRIRCQARAWTPTSAPVWASSLLDADPELVADLAVWRAGQRVDDDDPRLTGPGKVSAADVRAQRALNERIQRAASRSGTAAAEPRWVELARRLEPRLLTDPFWPRLADRLAVAERAGIDIIGLAEAALGERPLPDETPGAALWWRLSRHLTPAVLTASNSTEAETVSTLRPAWADSLVTVLGERPAQRVQADPAWPALVAAVSEATVGGWLPEQVLHAAYGLLGAPDVGHDIDGAVLSAEELATALVWRIAMLNEADDHVAHGRSRDLPPDPAALDQLPPDDLDRLEPPSDLFGSTVGQVPLARPVDPADGVDWEPDLEPPASTLHEPPGAAGATWLPAGELARPSLFDVGTEATPVVATNDVAASGVPRERLLQLNGQAQAFFVERYAGSWAAAYLRERLGSDLIEDPRFHPGQAPGRLDRTDRLPTQPGRRRRRAARRRPGLHRQHRPTDRPVP
jgi:hypothetical protein